MKNYLLNHLKKVLCLSVFMTCTLAGAGSYEDFFKAIKLDDAAGISRLLARGFDPNTLDATGQHGLTLALKESSFNVAQALVGAPKINLDHLNTSGESPLMLAALKGEARLAETMVLQGADVNKTGWTPLHYAASNGHVAIIKLLLENHAYIDAESPNGTTPLMMASLYGSVEAVKLLIEEGADASLKNEKGLTALEFAKSGNRLDAAGVLEKVTRSVRPTGTW